MQVNTEPNISVLVRFSTLTYLFNYNTNTLYVKYTKGWQPSAYSQAFGDFLKSLDLTKNTGIWASSPCNYTVLNQKNIELDIAALTLNANRN